MIFKKMLIFLVLLNSLYAGTMQSFLDDSINSVVEEPGYYKSQTRGLYSLGGAKVRFNNMGSFSPLNVEAPRFGMGCNGIDAVFGGFSYLDKEYLVDKLKAISSAAPAFAFQIALGVLCEDCKTTLNWLENIANQINNFNMDTCKASKRIGEFAADKIATAINGNMNSGQANNFIQATESAKSNQNSTWQDYTSTMSYYMGSDDLAKKSIQNATLQGSLISEAIENSSGVDVSILGTDPEGGNLFTSFIRVLVGDVVGYKSSISGSTGSEAGNGNGTPKLKFIPSGDINLKAMISGGKIDYVYVKTKDGNDGVPDVKSGTTNFTGIENIYRERLNSIISNMKARQTISDENRKFINSMPIPIAKYLNTTVLADLDDIESLVEYLAIIETKAFLNFIVSTTSKTLSYEIINTSDDQDPREVKDYLIGISKNASDVKSLINDWFLTSVKEWQQKKSINDYYIGLEQRMKSRMANSSTFNAFF